MCKGSSTSGLASRASMRRLRRQTLVHVTHMLCAFILQPTSNDQPYLSTTSAHLRSHSRSLSSLFPLQTMYHHDNVCLHEINRKVLQLLMSSVAGAHSDIFIAYLPCAMSQQTVTSSHSTFSRASKETPPGAAPS